MNDLQQNIRSDQQNIKKNCRDCKYQRIAEDTFLGIFTWYNYPQKLDRAIRCIIACKNIEEARQNAQSAEAT